MKMLRPRTATLNIATVKPLASEQARQHRRYLATNDVRWRQIRAVQLGREPNCRMCKAEGRDEPADHVDHINGRADRREDYEYTNLQSLCHPHHSQKTAAQQKGEDIPELPAPPVPSFTIA